MTITTLEDLEAVPEGEAVLVGPEGSTYEWVRRAEGFSLNDSDPIAPNFLLPDARDGRVRRRNDEPIRAGDYLDHAAYPAHRWGYVPVAPHADGQWWCVRLSRGAFYSVQLFSEESMRNPAEFRRYAAGADGAPDAATSRLIRALGAQYCSMQARRDEALEALNQVREEVTELQRQVRSMSQTAEVVPSALVEALHNHASLVDDDVLDNLLAEHGIGRETDHEVIVCVNGSFTVNAGDVRDILNVGVGDVEITELPSGSWHLDLTVAKRGARHQEVTEGEVAEQLPGDLADTSWTWTQTSCCGE